MAGGSNEYRAALVRRQLMPGLTSSFPGTAGLLPFISFRQATLSWTLPRYGSANSSRTSGDQGNFSRELSGDRRGRVHFM